MLQLDTIILDINMEEDYDQDIEEQVYGSGKFNNSSNITQITGETGA